MFKLVFILALIFVVSATTTIPCRLAVCRPRTASLTICAANIHQTKCHRMRECELEEENCRRRITEKTPLSYVGENRCRNIRGHKGNGPCASP